PTNCCKAAAPDLPRLAEAQSSTPDLSADIGPPAPVEKDSIRSASSSRTRPPLPPKEQRVSRGSMLQLVSTNPDLLGPIGYGQNGVQKKRKKYQGPLFQQFASLKHWFKESAKRTKSPNAKQKGFSPPRQALSTKPIAHDLRRISTAGPIANRQSGSHPRPSLRTSQTFPARPRLSTNVSTGSITTSRARLAHSPAPLTPHSSYRRSSVGLRGRKSTSSSVSSIRSIHHVHSHSKASSTSSASASVASPSHSTSGKMARSPHSSSTVKVLPATPTTSTFPSNIRVVRNGSISGGVGGFGGGTGSVGPGEAGAAFSCLPPPSPGLIFAKRKRSPFKGPMLLGMGLQHHHGGGVQGHGSHRRDREGSRSGSLQGRKSGELVIEEEDEGEEGEDGLGGMMEEGDVDEEEIEEVDGFSPIEGPGVFVEIREEAVDSAGEDVSGKG
ncbi:hypothetical protein LTS18_004056, partial [Coniosporium uncinatum]